MKDVANYAVNTSGIATATHQFVKIVMKRGENVMSNLVSTANINGNPAFWTTGIKITRNGSKRYKCRYYCECGQKGTHYIPLGIPQIECHECGYHILVQPAGKIGIDGVPNRDRFGSFYNAHAEV